MQLSFSGRLRKVKGKLVYEQGLLYQEFLDKIPEGDIVDAFLQVSGKDGSLDQLAKVHACIRALAEHTGYTFEEMKMLVKEQSGLVLKDTIRSFADCSTLELNLAIKACQEIGLRVGCLVQ